MRRTLKLLLLLGIGLLAARNKSPDGPDGGGDDIDPVTGRPRNSEQRDERLNFRGKNASTDMAGVHQEADQATQDGRAQDANGDGTPDIPDTSKPVEGPAANTDPRPPNDRHNLNRVGKNSPAKNENTIILPGTDVAGDIADIKAGHATWNPETQRYEVNGRTYGMELPKGTLFPDSGEGFVNLDRAQYQILKEMVRTNGDLDQAQQNISRNPFLQSESDWNAALGVFEFSNKYKG